MVRIFVSNLLSINTKIIFLLCKFQSVYSVLFIPHLRSRRMWHVSLHMWKNIYYIQCSLLFLLCIEICSWLSVLIFSQTVVYFCYFHSSWVKLVVYDILDLLRMEQIIRKYSRCIFWLLKINSFSCIHFT